MRDAGEIRALGEEATDKAIGIFIAAAFGGAVGVGDVMDGTSFVGGEAGGRDSSRVGELAAIIGGNGEEDRGEAFGTETSFEAIEQLNDALGSFSAQTEDELETGGAFSKDKQDRFGAGRTDDTIHFEMTELYTLIDRIRTFFDADSAGMDMGETFTDRLSAFLTRALNHITGGDANNALINVVVDCTGAERAVDAVSDEYLTGGIGGVLELPCYELRELRGKLVIGADL